MRSFNTYTETDTFVTTIWWRHQMETFSTLLAICAGNSQVPDEFPTQRPVTRSFDVFFDLRLNKRLSKQWKGWWFETLSRPLWRHRNDTRILHNHILTILITEMWIVAISTYKNTKPCFKYKDQVLDSRYKIFLRGILHLLNGLYIETGNWYFVQPYKPTL